MSNMSYCRFRNTLSDFRDCVDALRNIEAGQEEALSREELQAAKDLFCAANDALQALCENVGADVEWDLEDRDIERAIDEVQENAMDPEESEQS